MNRIFRILTFVLMVALAPIHISAQSASESYNKGLALMKKQDYNGAIASFKASMAINKSAANVKKCQAQINKCQKLIKSGKGASGSSTSTAQEKKLTIDKPRLWFPANPTEDLSTDIVTVPASNDWTAKVSDGEKWIELTKSMDGKALNVRCQPTDKTIVRSAHIDVTYNGLSRRIDVSQLGKRVAFSASTQFANFKLKGGTATIDINCNSDTIYSGDKNWIIKQTPDWIHAEATKTTLILKVDKVEKGDPAYKSGRTDNIILKSQTEELIIRVDQKKTFSINL